MPTFAELAAQARARAAGGPPPTPPAPPAAAPPPPAPVARPTRPTDLAALPNVPALVIPPTAPTTPVPAPTPEPVALAPRPLAPAPSVPQTPVPDISSRAMLVDLTIKMWSGSKLDREVTLEVAKNKNASAQSGRYTKNLIPREYLEPLKRIAQAAGDEHRRRTAPWGEHSRIIASDGWDDYQAAMTRHKEEWKPAVRNLIDNWPQIKLEAQRLNGALYDESEYPSQHQLEERYAFEYEVDNVPTAGDFRVAVSGIEQARITQQMERRMAEKIKATQAELAERIRETVGHMAERLRAYTGTREGAFRDTLVPNVEAVIALIPSLNITGDPALTQLAAQMRRELTSYSSADLRDDKAAREDVAEKANAILAKVTSILG